MIFNVIHIGVKNTAQSQTLSGERQSEKNPLVNRGMSQRELIAYRIMQIQPFPHSNFET